MLGPATESAVVVIKSPTGEDVAAALALNQNLLDLLQDEATYPEFCKTLHNSFVGKAGLDEEKISAAWNLPSTKKSMLEQARLGLLKPGTLFAVHAKYTEKCEGGRLCDADEMGGAHKTTSATRDSGVDTSPITASQQGGFETRNPQERGAQRLSWKYL